MTKTHSGEIVCIHIGQAGIQIGNACWELLAAEHGIRSDGTTDIDEDLDSSFQTFFQETPCGQFVPRSILVDLEPSVIDDIRVGSFSRIFHPDLLLEGMEDAGSNYARARFTRGQCVLSRLTDLVRYVTESCDAVQGFIVFGSYGGGTGSGLGSLLMNRLEHEYHRIPRIHIGVLPSARHSPIVVAPYNTALFALDMIEHADFSIIVENSSLYNVCQNKLSMDAPNYNHINRITSQIVSHLTTSLRYPGLLNNNLNEMRTNLIPFPRLKFPVVSYAPVLSAQRNSHQLLSTDELTTSVFDKSNAFVDCDLANGFFMSNSMIYRGTFNPLEINRAIKRLKELSNWVSWCPTGFKVGVSYQKPLFLDHSLIAPSDRSVMMVSNSTAISAVTGRMRKKFMRMFNKRAFIHWYVVEGMEESDFGTAFEEITTLEEHYHQINIAETVHDQMLEDGAGAEEEDEKPPPPSIPHGRGGGGGGANEGEGLEAQANTLELDPEALGLGIVDNDDDMEEGDEQQMNIETHNVGEQGETFDNVTTNFETIVKPKVMKKNKHRFWHQLRRKIAKIY